MSFSVRKAMVPPLMISATGQHKAGESLELEDCMCESSLFYDTMA